MSDQPRILVVEDDEDINQLLCNILESSGYVWQSAYSGTEALLHLEQSDWNLVLLDLMLPGLTGEELMAKIREQYHIPVIIISAKLEIESKVKLLRAGADDYITKPFDIDEVSARIDNCLLRHRSSDQPGAAEIIKFKDLELNVDAFELLVDGDEVKLTSTEFRILHTLMSSPKKVLSKANLFESVWEDRYYGDDNTINVHLSKLRHKLNRLNSEDEYIETVWGMGYKMKI
ncbi:response regulator transcription factor [Salinicoccus sp. YB14-2]|uniref:response regulator transcription factor n=1 Tax=Salinicoccus sp. YB14-2 TaxID=1572701 RepID=UPI00068C28F4|nr:response regulator transcription factor [Salinicoccus sp. YB14-2]